MKYLLHGPIEEPGSGGGMIFLFIPGGGRADKGSHSMPSPGTEAVGGEPWAAEVPLSGSSAQSLQVAKRFQLLAA